MRYFAGALVGFGGCRFTVHVAILLPSLGRLIIHFFQDDYSHPAIWLAFPKGLPVLEHNNEMPPIASDMAAELGYITVYWAHIEHIVASMIFSMIGTSLTAGEAITAELSAVQKLNLLSVFMNLTGKQEWIADWDARRKTIDIARARRNELLHSVWEFYNNEHSMKNVSARQTFKRTAKKVTLQEVTEFRRHLYGIILGLHWLGRTAFRWELTAILRDINFPDRTQNPNDPDQAPTRAPSPRHQKMEAAREAKRAKRKQHATTSTLAQGKSADQTN